MEKDSQARKYQITINNPTEKGLTHTALHGAVQSLKSVVYYCFCDEIGEQGTPHTHIYVVFSAPVRFSTIKRLFPAAHIEKALGTSQENRDYLLKAGKWANSAKGETTVSGSFEEWGSMPIERKGKEKNAATLEELYSMIKAGLSDYEIFENNPGHIRYSAYIDRVRQSVAREEIQYKRRQMKVTYVFGDPGTDKTGFVMAAEDGSINPKVYRVTDYLHPFDGYTGQPILLLDRFHDSMDAQNLITYIDGYPIELPARYSNRVAAYTEVYICSTVPIEEQYHGVRINNSELWHEFLQKVDLIIELRPDGQRLEYTTAEYFTKKAKAPSVASPFDTVVV